MIDYGMAPQPRFVIVEAGSLASYLILVDDQFPEAEALEGFKHEIRKYHPYWTAGETFTRDGVRSFLGMIESARWMIEFSRLTAGATKEQ